MAHLLSPSRVEILRDKELKALKDAEIFRKEIDDIIRTCTHVWGATEYFPEETNTFDPPPYEKDYYGPGWTPRPYVRTEPRFWVRKCSRCGLVQQTSSTKLEATSNGLRKEVPDFRGK